MISMKMKTPYDSIRDFGKWFSEEKKWTFFISIIVGYITHFILLAEGVQSQDGLCQSIRYFAGVAETSVGRWGIGLLERLRANYAVSFLSASISIVLVATAAVLIVASLDLKSRLSAVLTAVLFETAPALTVTLLYEYVSDLYCLSLLFACLAAFVLIRKKHTIVNAAAVIVFIIFSLNIYQSYIGFTIGLCIMAIVTELLKKDTELIPALKRFLWYVVTVFCGFLAYYLSVIIVQKITDIQPSGYNGVNQVTVLGILQQLPASVLKTYREFAQYFFRDTYIFNTSWHRDIFFAVFFAFFAMALLYLIIKNKLFKNIGKLVITILLGLCIPIAVNVILLILPEASLYALTSLQMLLVIPFAFAVMEQCLKERAAILQWGIILALIPVAVTYYFADVLTYTCMKQTKDQSLTTANRILDRMENTEGYYLGMPVAFAGWLNDENYPQDQSYWEYTLGGVVTNRVAHGDFYPNTESIRRLYISDFDVSLNMADPATYSAVVSSDEFQEMDVYPAVDSVRIIDGCMVVKMMEDPYMPY